MRNITILLAGVLLLAGCSAPPAGFTPSPSPDADPVAGLPAGSVQIALIRDYMGSDCRGTDGGLFPDGCTLRVQKLDLSCDGERVDGTVEGLRAGYSDFESSCTYFRASVHGVVGVDDGIPYVERLTYGDCVWGPAFHMQRLEKAITGEDRSIIARRWYDRPTVHNADAAETVNAYFEHECETFMEQDGASFWDNAMELIGQMGTDRFSAYPLRETVTTKLTYLDEGLLSVQKSLNWYMAGTSPIHCSGDIFDLHTGERLALDHFVEMDILDFNDWVTDRVCGLGWQREDVEGYYSGLTFSDYSYAYDGESIHVFLKEPYVAGGAPVLRFRL